MSCGRIALDRAGIDVEKYHSSEVDKHAIQVSNDNYPDIVRLGDVEKWPEWDIDWSSIDLILAGSPCQGFSFAGDCLEFDDPRSKLFFEYADILNQIKKVNPNVKSLLENVKMKQRCISVISDKLEIEPIEIDSRLVSGQNRKRLYWCNWNVEQPHDKNILFSDVIQPESEIEDVMYYKEKSIAYMNRGSDKWQQAGDCRMDRYLQTREKEKSFTLTANMHKGAPYNFCLFGDRYRKLTPIECERLQTVPDNYTQSVSNTQRYKMLGNGWTVDVIAHILKSMDTEKKPEQQGDLFA